MKRSFSIPIKLQSFFLFKIVRLMEDAKEILANMSTLLTIHINCSWQMSLWMTKGYIGKFSVSSKYSKKSNLFQNSPKGPFGAFRWGATAPLKYFSSGLTSAHLLFVKGSFGANELFSWVFFCQLNDRHKRGHPFWHGLGVSMPRPFRKGIACHGSMPVRPFSPESFVALYNDTDYSGRTWYVNLSIFIFLCIWKYKIHLYNISF